MQEAHRTQSERRRSVAEAEHVRRHIQHHRAHRGMIDGHFRKQPAHQRTQRASEQRDKPGALGEAHHAEPDGHEPHEWKCNIHHGVFRGLERTVGHRGEIPAEAADDDGDKNHDEPDDVEHEVRNINQRGEQRKIFIDPAPL